MGLLIYHNDQHSTLYGTSCLLEYKNGSKIGERSVNPWISCLQKCLISETMEPGYIYYPAVVRPSCLFLNGLPLLSSRRRLKWSEASRLLSVHQTSHRREYLSLLYASKEPGIWT